MQAEGGSSLTEGRRCVCTQVTASASKARCMPSLARSSASLPRKDQWAAVRTSKPRHSFTPRALRQGVFATDVEVSEAAAEASDEPKAERKPRAPKKEITVQQEEIVEGTTFKGTVVRVSSHHTSHNTRPTHPHLTPGFAIQPARSRQLAASGKTTRR